MFAYPARDGFVILNVATPSESKVIFCGTVAPFTLSVDLFELMLTIMLEVPVTLIVKLSVPFAIVDTDIFCRPKIV